MDYGERTSPEEVLSGMSTMDPSWAVPPPLKNDTLGEPPYKLCRTWVWSICEHK